MAITSGDKAWLGGGSVPPSGASASRGGPRSNLLRGVIALIILILAGGLAFTSLRLQNDESLSSLRSGAIRAASADAVYEASYDYHDLSGAGTPWARLLADSTASFRQRFQSTEASLGKVLVQYKATAKANIVASGLSSITGRRAVVLLFIDQTVTNTVQKSGAVTQPLRVELTMLRQGGRWLVDDVNVPK